MKEDKGILPTDRWTDICDCRVAFATENWTQICVLVSQMMLDVQLKLLGTLINGSREVDFYKIL